MRLFGRRVTPAEAYEQVCAHRDARVAITLRREAEKIVMREARPILLAREVERLRAELGLTAPETAPEIVTPEPTPEPAPVTVPKVRKPRKVSPAQVEAPVPPAPASADVAKVAPATASPVVAVDAKVSERPRKRRTVAAKVETPEIVTVAMPVTVREPCGVETVWQPKKGGKCASLGIVFK